MKAYYCETMWENGAEFGKSYWVTSAEDAKEARKKAKKKGLTVIKCRRMPEADKYECASDIPARLLMRRGAPMHCNHCGHEFSVDNKQMFISHGRAYCWECMMAAERRWLEKNAAK